MATLTAPTTISTATYLRRALMEVVNEATMMMNNNNETWAIEDENSVDEVPPLVEDESTSSSASESGSFDPKIFWSVNAFILVLFVGVVCYCCYGDLSWLTNMHERRREADAEYQRTIRQREEERKQSRLLPPEKRRRLLLSSFRRNHVTMTVEEKDLVHDNSTKFTKPDDAPQQLTIHNGELIVEDFEASVASFENNGQLRLPTQALVPNCCAICLGNYDAGDEVVWSSNESCPHAFHQQCLVDWLIKMQPATPCPCCRQEFTDWQEIATARKIKWNPGNTMDLGRIRW